MIKREPRVGFGVMVFKKDKVLLGRRHSDPKKAKSLLHGEGTWTMPGGKLHFGESFEAGAKRELFEETGLQAQKFEVISLTNDIVADAHFITIGLLCEEFEGTPRVLEPKEIVAWRWFPLERLPRPVFFPSRKIIKNFQRRIFYGA